MVMDYDPDIIGEVISNLLSNAVKFTPHGGNIYVQADATIADEKVFIHSLFVNVRDTGTGIAEDKLPYIFERFYQADDESTRKAEGTGIGLALVKEYINLLKGTIQVKSKTGKGTSFLMTLPVTHGAPLRQVDLKDSKKNFNTFPEKDERIIIAESQAAEDIQDGLPLLLIVEDNNDVVEYLLSVLNHKYQAIVARNGNEGIYKAVESVPDIIICDVMMPEKDGYEVCSALKNDFRTNHIPIVMLTAKADIDSKIAGLEFGADAYIIKPFNKKELLVRLEKLIENRQKLKDKYGEMIYAAAKAGKPKGLNEVFLQKITTALEKNYQDENYGIFKLCLDIGISRAQLHRKLIALTGKSTSDLIRHYRMKKAKDILLTSDKSISEIAYQVGFKDPNYFTKSFTREYGMTPTQFRSENHPVKQ
jgi:DNA-binding response OmpR family regulator